VEPKEEKRKKSCRRENEKKNKGLVIKNISNKDKKLNLEQYNWHAFLFNWYRTFDYEFLFIKKELSKMDKIIKLSMKEGIASKTNLEVRLFFFSISPWSLGTSRETRETKRFF